MAKSENAARRVLNAAQLVVADLPNRRDVAFELVLDEAQLKAAKATLDVLDLQKVRLNGVLSPAGRSDWTLEAQLGASVTQACVVTLNPVKTRIEEAVHRQFVADWVEPEADSVVEMDEDVESEPLGDLIDLETLTLEAIALAMPDYPRASDATLGTRQFAEPGVDPMTDEAAKPFAGLAALKEKLEK